MPYSAPRPCRHQGCAALVTRGAYCPEHLLARQADQQARDRQRGSAHQRGYGAKWRKTAAGWLREHPLCCLCEQAGRVEAATDVDHIVPHRGDMGLFWDPTNWQSLCHRCHSRKTAAEDGGFGNRPGRDGSGREEAGRGGSKV